MLQKLHYHSENTSIATEKLQWEALGTETLLSSLPFPVPAPDVAPAAPDCSHSQLSTMESSGLHRASWTMLAALLLARIMCYNYHRALK